MSGKLKAWSGEFEPWDGLNGTTLLRVRDMPVGTASGKEYWSPSGRPYRATTRIPVTVDVRMERLERSKTYETVTHEMVEHPTSFALTTSVWRPNMDDIVFGGATVQPLRELLARAPHGGTHGGWRQDIETMIRWHDEYHLSDMQAGCAHQTVPPIPEGYTRNRTYWALDNTPVCPITGYRYGSKWLVKPLPEGMVTEVRDLLVRFGAEIKGELA